MYDDDEFAAQPQAQNPQVATIPPDTGSPPVQTSDTGSVSPAVSVPTHDTENTTETSGTSSTIPEPSPPPAAPFPPMEDTAAIPLGKDVVRKSLLRVYDFVTNTTHQGFDSDFADSSWYPLDDYVACSRFSENHRDFLAAITEAVIPASYKEAFEDKNWREVDHVEIEAFEERETWIVVALPPGKRAIGCKWVFTFKFRVDDTLERYKARLVVLGNNQTQGIDYEEHSHRCVRWNQFLCFCKLQWLVIGRFTKWISIMLSCMVTCWKKFI